MCVLVLYERFVEVRLVCVLSVGGVVGFGHGFLDCVCWWGFGLVWGVLECGAGFGKGGWVCGMGGGFWNRGLVLE